MSNGELLKSSRKKLGFTQQDLADYFGIGQREIISYWEQGKRPLPEEILKVVKRILRMNKKDAQSQFKRKSSNCKKELSNRGKDVKFIPGEKKYIGQGVYDSNSLHSLGKKSTQNEGGCQFSIEKYPADSIERYILDAYIEFKQTHKRFPIEADFISGTFREIKKKEILQYFGSLSNAKKLAGELKKYESARKRRGGIIRTFSPPGQQVKPVLGDRGFLCPCCGKAWKGINDFYNAMREKIKERLSHIEQNFESYQIALLELMAFLFGTQEVERLGYDTSKLENGDICFCGGQFKPSWQSSFKTIVINRLLDLLQSSDSQGPEETIKDCTIAIFGKTSNKAFN